MTPGVLLALEARRSLELYADPPGCLRFVPRPLWRLFLFRDPIAMIDGLALAVLAEATMREIGNESEQEAKEGSNP